LGNAIPSIQEDLILSSSLFFLEAVRAEGSFAISYFRVFLMDKRTIIAFVLSFLVLIAWAYIFAPKQRKAPPESEPPKEAAAPQPKKAVSAQPSVTAEQPPLIEVPAASTSVAETEKKITVETPLYEAVFSSKGAAIESFKLKNYHVSADPGSPFVDLAEAGQSQENLIRVLFDRQGARSQENIVYKVNTDSLFLDAGSSPKSLIFSGVTPDGIAIQQTYRIHPDRYPIELSLTLANRSDRPVEGNFKVQIRNIPPKHSSSYYAFVGASLLLNSKLKEIKPGDMKKEKDLSGPIGWISYQSAYFITAAIPENPSPASFLGLDLPSGIVEATYIGPFVAVAPMKNVPAQFTLYLGPKDLSILKETGHNLDLAINFGWTDIIAKPLLYVLKFFDRYVKNYGLSIILLTLMIKILFWPLTHKSYKSMKEMQKIQPLMAKIREKYKGNKEQMNKEVMGLYKTYKVNPMGGCLPMIIQIPVFFALYRILGSAIELRHAPFALWIKDLSAPDRLFNFPFQIPYMSPPYGIPVLTLLMGVSMYIQQKMTPSAGDPTQAKIMMLMPIIFTFMFINFPSGLVLYWLTNNILSIGQQYRIIKRSA
jgi:YidC/Oxa1 family membrane protein insertase